MSTEQDETRRSQPSKRPKLFRNKSARSREAPGLFERRGRLSSRFSFLANKLSHRRLPLPFVTGFVVLQPSGVELVFFPCRDVVDGPAVGGSFQWVHDPTIGCVL